MVSFTKASLRRLLWLLLAAPVLGQDLNVPVTATLGLTQGCLVHVQVSIQRHERPDPSLQYLVSVDALLQRQSQQQDPMLEPSMTTAAAWNERLLDMTWTTTVIPATTLESDMANKAESCDSSSPQYLVTGTSSASFVIPFDDTNDDDDKSEDSTLYMIKLWRRQSVNNSNLSMPLSEAPLQFQDPQVLAQRIKRLPRTLAAANRRRHDVYSTLEFDIVDQNESDMERKTQDAVSWQSIKNEADQGESTVGTDGQADSTTTAAHAPILPSKQSWSIWHGLLIGFVSTIGLVLHIVVTDDAFRAWARGAPAVDQQEHAIDHHDNLQDESMAGNTSATRRNKPGKHVVFSPSVVRRHEEMDANLFQEDDSDNEDAEQSESEEDYTESDESDEDENDDVNNQAMDSVDTEIDESDEDENEDIDDEAMDSADAHVSFGDVAQAYHLATRDDGDLQTAALSFRACGRFRESHASDDESSVNTLSPPTMRRRLSLSFEDVMQRESPLDERKTSIEPETDQPRRMSWDGMKIPGLKWSPFHRPNLGQRQLVRGQLQSSFAGPPASFGDLDSSRLGMHRVSATLQTKANASASAIKGSDRQFSIDDPCQALQQLHLTKSMSTPLSETPVGVEEESMLDVTSVPFVIKSPSETVTVDLGDGSQCHSDRLSLLLDSIHTHQKIDATQQYATPRTGTVALEVKLDGSADAEASEKLPMDDCRDVDASDSLNEEGITGSQADELGGSVGEGSHHAFDNTLDSCATDQHLPGSTANEDAHGVLEKEAGDLKGKQKVLQTGADTGDLSTPLFARWTAESDLAANDQSTLTDGIAPYVSETLPPGTSLTAGVTTLQLDPPSADSALSFKQPFSPSSQTVDAALGSRSINRHALQQSSSPRKHAEPIRSPLIALEEDVRERDESGCDESNKECVANEETITVDFHKSISNPLSSASLSPKQGCPTVMIQPIDTQQVAADSFQSVVATPSVLESTDVDSGREQVGPAMIVAADNFTPHGTVPESYLQSHMVTARVSGRKQSIPSVFDAAFSAKNPRRLEFRSTSTEDVAQTPHGLGNAQGDGKRKFCEPLDLEQSVIRAPKRVKPADKPLDESPDLSYVSTLPPNSQQSSASDNLDWDSPANPGVFLSPVACSEQHTQTQYGNAETLNAVQDLSKEQPKSKSTEKTGDEAKRSSDEVIRKTRSSNKEPTQQAQAEQKHAAPTRRITRGTTLQPTKGPTANQEAVTKSLAKSNCVKSDTLDELDFVGSGEGTPRRKKSMQPTVSSPPEVHIPEYVPSIYLVKAAEANSKHTLGFVSPELPSDIRQLVSGQSSLLTSHSQLSKDKKAKETTHVKSKLKEAPKSLSAASGASALRDSKPKATKGSRTLVKVKVEPSVKVKLEGASTQSDTSMQGIGPLVRRRRRSSRPLVATSSSLPKKCNPNSVKDSSQSADPQAPKVFKESDDQGDAATKRSSLSRTQDGRRKVNEK